MIRIIIDNLLCMGIAAAVISLLMLITGALSLGRFHARWHLAGWMIAMFTLLIPVYALIGIIQPGSVFPIPQVQAEKYYAEYTAFMGRSITDILNRELTASLTWKIYQLKCKWIQPLFSRT